MLHMSPREVLEKHTPRELAEWAAYLQLNAVERQRAQDSAELQRNLPRRRR